MRSGIVISAGFRELGPKGAELERQIARRTSPREHAPGRSQLSGHDESEAGPQRHVRGGYREAGKRRLSQPERRAADRDSRLEFAGEVGFSAIVSTGSMLDVGWGDLISFFGEDPETQSILLYMESIGDARAFLSAAREVALSKPIIVIKAGRSEAASHAASSHTGALTGSDEVFDAAFRRCGVLRVQSISDLFYMAEVLGKQPRPRGPRLTILTNAGGPGVLATDALIATGGELAPLSAAIARVPSTKFSRRIGATAIRSTSWATPTRSAFARALAVAIERSRQRRPARHSRAAGDDGSRAHGRGAQAVCARVTESRCWPVGWAAKQLPRASPFSIDAGIPTFAYPDTAARAFNYMWRYSLQPPGAVRNSRRWRTNPKPGEPIRKKAQEILGRVHGFWPHASDGSRIQGSAALYGIPTVQTRLAHSEDEAARFGAGNRISRGPEGPLGNDHAQDRRGRRETELRIDDAVRQAFESIRSSVVRKGGVAGFSRRHGSADGSARGIRTHPGKQRGRAIRAGDSIRFRRAARRSLSRPRSGAAAAQYHAGAAADGADANLPRAQGSARPRGRSTHGRLEQLLVRFSQLVVEQPRIKEIDINPLLASRRTLLGSRRAHRSPRAGSRWRKIFLAPRSGPIRRSTSRDGR